MWNFSQLANAQQFFINYDFKKEQQLGLLLFTAKILSIYAIIIMPDDTS